MAVEWYPVGEKWERQQLIKEKNSWVVQTVSSNARSCQRDAPEKSFTHSVHTARSFAWLSLAPAVRSLISTLLRPQPDGGGNSSRPHDLPCTEKVTNHVLPFLMPHGGVLDLVLVVIEFEVMHASFNMYILGSTPLTHLCVKWMPQLTGIRNHVKSRHPKAFQNQWKKDSHFSFAKTLVSLENSILWVNLGGYSW